MVSAVEHADTATHIFEVSESFRGVNTQKVEVITSRMLNCGGSFAVGSEYLVYAHSSFGSLSVDICSGSKLLRDASADLRYIRHFGEEFSAAKAMPGYVFGMISNREPDLQGLTDPTWPIPGVDARDEGIRCKSD